MKWWFACLLLIITASGTFIPCCQSDQCNAKEISATNNHKDEDNKGMCSPFNACASCVASVELNTPVEYSQPIKQAQVYYERLQAFDPAHYTNLCWQPPRSC